MSWSEKTKEASLVASGRHCCICHRFCGLKIELHHIKHKSQGGTDVFENCIPLCFDCHADQRSYDHQHPKGTKYSEQELIKHRDNWFLKVKNSVAITNLPEYLAIDRKLYEKIRNMLPYETVSMLVKDDKRIHRKDLNSVYMLLMESKNPEFIFMDSDLESGFAMLHSHLEPFYTHLVKHTELLKDNDDIYRLEFSSQSEQAVSSKLAFAFEDSYIEFFKLARRKLAT